MNVVEMNDERARLWSFFVCLVNLNNYFKLRATFVYLRIQQFTNARVYVVVDEQRLQWFIATEEMRMRGRKYEKRRTPAQEAAMCHVHVWMQADNIGDGISLRICDGGKPVELWKKPWGENNDGAFKDSGRCAHSMEGEEYE